MHPARRGIVYGVLAYGLWGIVPVFWKQLGSVPPLELLGHRVVWGLLTLLALSLVSGRWGALRAAVRDRRVRRSMLVSSVLLTINWGIFVYAVSANRMVDASMGYFINPLVSVALGVLALGERLRRPQQLALGLAALGVCTLTVQRGAPPYLALVLAGSFGFYGLVRKTARVDSLAGTALETALMTPLALLLLGALAARGGGALGHAPLRVELLLLATGVVTTVPLLLFTAAARRLPLTTVGFLQYLAPTGQLLLAVGVYGEPFDGATLLAFGLIWLGLAVFSLDAWRAVPR
ncbi:MAG: EamA family transporter RarD [Kofleriaceae bacterium]